MSLSATGFECRLYISARDQFKFVLPEESGPQKIASLSAPDYDQLVDPAFRRLLVAFESLPHELQLGTSSFVQV